MFQSVFRCNKSGKMIQSKLKLNQRKLKYQVTRQMDIKIMINFQTKKLKYTHQIKEKKGITVPISQVLLIHHPIRDKTIRNS